MKSSRFQFQYRESASKLHRTVGEVLRKSFSGYRVYQEYPVSRINPSYRDTSHHFDWVILDLNVVIECNGEQHESISCFGGTDCLSALENLTATRRRDIRKMEAAIEAGWTYIVIPWYDISRIDSSYLWTMIQEAQDAEHN